MTRLEVRKYGNKKYCKNLFHVFEILELSLLKIYNYFYLFPFGINELNFLANKFSYIIVHQGKIGQLNLFHYLRLGIKPFQLSAES